MLIHFSNFVLRHCSLHQPSEKVISTSGIIERPGHVLPYLRDGSKRNESAPVRQSYVRMHMVGAQCLMPLN